MSSGQAKYNVVAREGGFETSDFYLACFLRCTGYELLDLRAEGRRKVFVFRDRPSRRDDVLSFYGDGAMASTAHSSPEGVRARRRSNLQR